MRARDAVSIAVFGVVCAAPARARGAEGGGRPPPAAPAPAPVPATLEGLYPPGCVPSAAELDSRRRAIAAIQRLRSAGAQLSRVGRDQQAREINARADELLQQLRAQIEESCRERARIGATAPAP